MPNDAEAAAAMTALDGKEVGGRNLKVNEARPKGEGGPPRGPRNFGGPGGGSGGGRGKGGGRDRFSNQDYRESARQPRQPPWEFFFSMDGLHGPGTRPPPHSSFRRGQ